jgi:two-component system sensor histidine kinase CpxA
MKIPMPKINLFVKIYLCFLLTIIFTMAMMICLDRLTGSGPIIDRLRHDIGRTLSFYGQEAVNVLEHEGFPALKEFNNRLETTTGIRGFLFDRNGKEVSGRTENRTIKVIADTLNNNPQKEFIFLDERRIAAQTVRSPRGSIYTFAVEFSNFHPAPPPDHPRTINASFMPPAPISNPPWPLPHMMPFHFLLRIVLSLTVAGIACYLLARYLTTPIIKLEQATRQLAAGNLSVRVPPSIRKGKGEISTLAVDFDLMAERLEKLMTAQRNLLRDVSHELRSPLARLNVALGICQQQSSSDAQPSLDRIEREINKLKDLIGQILTWNKVESGTEEIKKTRVDLAMLIQEITSDSDYEARSHNRTVISTVEACVLKGNRDILLQAIENVVRNAIHYTAEGSAVEVRLCNLQHAGARQALITVRDHGKGVPEEALTELFRPFYRVGEDRDRETGGVGLGLAISYASIHLHGGNIRALNAPDGGLIVEITLPIG